MDVYRIGGAAADWIALAKKARRDHDYPTSTKAYRKALALEARSIPMGANEKTRGTLCSSAANVALKGACFREAESLALQGLRGAPDGQTQALLTSALILARHRLNPLLDDLARQFPGVTFDGLFVGATIQPGVRIEPGAEVHLNPGLNLYGKTSLGPTAFVLGGVVSDSIVHGSVTGGFVHRSRIEADADVSGGAVVESELRARSVVADAARVLRSKLDGAHVSGTAQVVSSSMGAGARVIDRAFVGGIDLDPGVTVSGETRLDPRSDLPNRPR